MLSEKQIFAYIHLAGHNMRASKPLTPYTARLSLLNLGHYHPKDFCTGSIEDSYPDES